MLVVNIHIIINKIIENNVQALRKLYMLNNHRMLWENSEVWDIVLHYGNEDVWQFFIAVIPTTIHEIPFEEYVERYSTNIFFQRNR